MNKSIEQRMRSIEDQLKEIRKELEESLARYKQSQYPFSKYTSPAHIPKAWASKCLWESIPEEDRYKPMGLSCSCVKCSAWC